MNTVRYTTVLLLLLLASCDAQARGRLAIRNAASEGIRAVDVLVSDRQHVIGRIDRGETHMLEFPIRRETGYLMHVTFDSGRELQQDFGYVAAGLPIDDIVEVRDDRFVDGDGNAMSTNR
jgi:hypothetical protein